MNDSRSSSIVGIGTDIIEISRIQQALDRHGDRFMERVFTSTEIAYCNRQAVPARHFAARFAAKEAVSKALGTGISGDLGWQDIEITHNDRKKPVVILSDSVGVSSHSVLLSMSHCKEYATATAVIT